MNAECFPSARSADDDDDRGEDLHQPADRQQEEIHTR